MALDCDRLTDASISFPIARPSGGTLSPVQVFLWFLLFLLAVAGVFLIVRSVRQRRERERLWGALEGEPTLPTYNEDSLGVGPVRVHATPHLAEDDALAGPIPNPIPMPEPVSAAPADEALLDPAAPPDEEGPTHDSPFRESAEHDEEADAPTPPPRATEPSAEVPPHDGPRLMRARSEWWEDDAPGTGPLLRSLVEATGGSAALVRPDPSDDGYLILAAAGPASSALHAHRKARRFGADALTDLPREAVTVVLGPAESGVLPGMDPAGVAETAVRALAPAPSPRRLLVVDVPDGHPLDQRSERLIQKYGDLLADVLGLSTEPPSPEPPPAPADPVDVAMEAVAEEIADARETGRGLAFALVVPYEQDTMMEADPEAVGAHEEALRERLETLPGTRRVAPMGALVFGAVCDAEPGRVERWARSLSNGGPQLRIGIAVYGPRHVTPDHLRQDAAHALRETYKGDDTCVILE